MFGSIRGERSVESVRGGLNRSFKGRNVSIRGGRGEREGISVNGWTRGEEEEGSSQKRGSSPLSSVSFTALSGFLRGGWPGVSSLAKGNS